MAMAVHKVGDGLGAVGSKFIPNYWADFLRANLFPTLHFRQLGTKVTIPRAMGDSVKIPRWKSPLKTTASKSVLTGVMTAVEQAAQFSAAATVFANLSAEYISGSVQQFRGARGYNDKLVIVSYADFMEGALDSLQRELGYRIDRYTRNSLSANVGRVLQVGGSKVATNSGLRGKELAKIAPYMDAANVPRWEDDTHVAIVHPLAQYDLFSDISSSGWISVAQYGDPDRIYRGEVGQMYGVRFLLSNAMPILFGTANLTGVTNTSTGLSGSATGSNLYVFAPDAFYSLELEDGGVEVIHHPLGSGGATGDPTNNLGSIGVKVFYGVLPAPSADHRLMRMAHGFGLAR